MKYTNLFTIGMSALMVLSLPLTQAAAMGTSGETSGSATSQPSGSGHPVKSVEKKLAKLTAALSLTSDEQSKIRSILEQESLQVKALHADQSLSKADHATKLKQIHGDAKVKIAAILNSDQQRKFADMGPGHRASTLNKG